MSPLPHSLAMAMEGVEISEAEAVRLESQLRDDPNDLGRRARLLGYYFRRANRETRAARHRHVMWLIRRHSESPLAGSPFAAVDATSDRERYEEAKAAWVSQVAANPDHTAIIANAAMFMMIHDPGGARALLKQAQALDPNNPLLGKLLAEHDSLLAAGKRRNTIEPQRVAPRDLTEACQREHAKLVAGRCPVCGRLVLHGQAYDVPDDWWLWRGRGVQKVVHGNHDRSGN